MLYSKVYINSIGYELGPNIITSDDIEKRLEPLYEKLNFKKGQLKALTGINERRLWNSDYPMSQGGIKAGRKALNKADLKADEIDILIYAGVCRDNLEPATACAVANGLGIGGHAQVFDISNACLGVLNGIIHIANSIELGHAKAGLVVSCESSRQILDITIKRLLENRDMDVFKKTVATLTGGSGAVAVLVTDNTFSDQHHRILGGVLRNAAEHHKLCVWGPDTGIPSCGYNVIETDSNAVLKNGVVLGIETYEDFKKELSIKQGPDKIVCHQVGSAHQNEILKSINIPVEKDFTTYRYLGNMGTVSLPLTAAIADEREFLSKDDLVGFLGIGSGLNCLMLGIRW